MPENVFYFFYVVPSDTTGLPYISAWFWGSVVSKKLTLKIGVSPPLNDEILELIRPWRLDTLDGRDWSEIEATTVRQIVDVRSLVGLFQRPTVRQYTQQEKDQEDDIALFSPSRLEQRITEFDRGLIDLDTLETIITRQAAVFVGSRQQSDRIYRRLPAELRRRVVFENTSAGFMVRPRASA